MKSRDMITAGYDGAAHREPPLPKVGSDDKSQLELTRWIDEQAVAVRMAALETDGFDTSRYGPGAVLKRRSW